MRQRIEELKEQLSDLQATLIGWRESGLPEKTLLILLNHSTKVPQKTIRTVLEGLENLEADYFEEFEDD